MSRLVHYLWLIPALPLAAAALTALAKQRQRKFAATLAIASMALAFLLSGLAFVSTLQRSGHGGAGRGFQFLLVPIR